MSAKAAALILGAAMTAALLDCAVAATITVGSPGSGWDQSTDLPTWAASQTFSVGDTLVFRYLPSHDVLEVSKADYDACLASTPVNSYTGGSTTVPLTKSGKRYFICGTAGHCAQGMKLEVDVGAAKAAAPPTTAANAPKSAVAPAADIAPGLAPDAPVTAAPAASNAASPSPAASTLQRPSPSTATAGTRVSAAAIFASGLLVLLAS